MRREPTTDELPIAKTVELPDGSKTVEMPGGTKSADPPDGNASRATDRLPAGEGPADNRDPQYSEGRTTELPSSQRGRHRPETMQVRQTDPAPKSRFWRELTGALTAGTVLLAIAVLVLQVTAWFNGMPGLGVVVLVGHLVGATLAIAAQRLVDRRSGKPALAAGLSLGAVVVSILVLFWWI
jgi:hypothetical protein